MELCACRSIDGYWVGGGDGGAVVSGRVVGDREAGAGTDEWAGELEVACAAIVVGGAGEVIVCAAVGGVY